MVSGLRPPYEARILDTPQITLIVFEDVHSNTSCPRRDVYVWNQSFTCERRTQTMGLVGKKCNYLSLICLKLSGVFGVVAVGNRLWVITPPLYYLLP